jgi:hypothetical protein
LVVDHLPIRRGIFDNQPPSSTDNSSRFNKTRRLKPFAVELPTVSPQPLYMRAKGPHSAKVIYGVMLMLFQPSRNGRDDE